jgi:hypothetical protein
MTHSEQRQGGLWCRNTEQVGYGVGAVQSGGWVMVQKHHNAGASDSARTPWNSRQTA